jgi:hypothetical protein
VPLVALTTGSCLAVVVSGLSTEPAAPVAALAGLTGWAVGLLLLRRRLEHAADLPDDQLDEREVEVRDRSYLHAYQALGGALALLLFVTVVDESPLGDGEVVQSWTYLVLSLLLLALALPSVVLAVRQRRTPDD